MQVGCAMNCQFCLTGRMGLMANLSTAQIVEQVPAALNHKNVVKSESITRSLALIALCPAGRAVKGSPPKRAIHMTIPEASIKSPACAPQVLKRDLILLVSWSV